VDSRPMSAAVAWIVMFFFSALINSLLTNIDNI
jgi:hypothetical protein